MEIFTVFLLILAFCVALFSGNVTESLNTNEDEAKVFLERYNTEFSAMKNLLTKAQWNHMVNITDNNAAIVTEMRTRVSNYSDVAFRKASTFDLTSFGYETKRLLGKVGSPSLSQKEMLELSKIMTEMSSIYSSYQVCAISGKCSSLEPELQEIMTRSTNASERLWAWKEWHEGVGRTIRPLFIKYVDLKNRLARLKNYEDYGDQWRQEFEAKDLEPMVLELYRQIEPLYRQLHAYIRRQLFNTYGPDVIDLKGPLPAHLLGDMWGRFWSGLTKLAQPYKNKSSVDPSPAMIEQNYTVRRMFEMGDDFFKSMGLKPVPDTFYNLSMLEKPSDPNRKVLCHPYAEDFHDGKDFRVKMCTLVNFQHFLTIHHELGHVQYYSQYAHLPISFREGANGGFHEAIGEILAMSAATPKHLHSVGLLNTLENDDEEDINFLMEQALRTVSTLPFHLVMDTWRWKLFRGQVETSKWNQDFWNQKIEVVGVAPAIARDDQLDLDATALLHIPEDVPMIYYFTRTIMQYQFAEALCKAANHVAPLHKCDFYNSVEAGSALARMMSMGSSRPWPDAMEALTGQREMSTEPLLKYFQPLMDWLKKENARNEEFIGWSLSSSLNQPTTTEKLPKSSVSGGTKFSPENHLLLIFFFLSFFIL